MCAWIHPPRSLFPGLIVFMVVVVMLAGWPVIGSADAADPRLERAQERRVQMQSQLDGVMQRVHALEAKISEAEDTLAELQRKETRHKEEASTASGLFAARIRESYMRGTVDPMLDLLSVGSPEQAADQARALNLLAVRSQAELEGASAARIQTRATALEVEKATESLRTDREALESARQEAAQLFAQAQAQEDSVKDTIAREEAARRRAAETRAARADRTRAARGQVAASGRSAGAAAPVSGGVACPVGQPRSFSDTYGAPRSGGRAHKGVDIMAPRGTPIYAYENGTVSRMNSSRLGGISLYMRGDSGNSYYYTHLQGYVAGVSAGQRVSVGQHIAYNGDTGNARGIPHLHWEVMPGGGGNVNPYPYAKRACG